MSNNISSSMQSEHNYSDVYGCIEAGTSQRLAALCNHSEYSPP